MTIQVSHRTFTATEFQRMLRAGVLTEDERVELLEGEIVVMTPIGSRHAACVNRLNRLFSACAGAQAIVAIQNPVRLDIYSEPQPDVALLRPRPDYYAGAHPTAQDTLLIVEVIETSADYDRRVKVPLYARAGVPEVWLINLNEARVEVYSQPSTDGYRQIRVAQRGEELSPQGIGGAKLRVDDLVS